MKQALSTEKQWMYKYEYLLHTTAVCANECQEICANILWSLLKDYMLVIVLFYQMISQ
jgi:hypothetical protein